MTEVHTTLRAAAAAAAAFASANPELHAEYLRRRRTGEWFREGEPVTIFMREYTRLNQLAVNAACEDLPVPSMSSQHSS